MKEGAMEAEFAREILSRLPLAEAVLSLWRWVADPLFLLSVFARHRGQGYEKEVSFGVLVQLIADALLEHRGSGKKSFERGREQGLLTASVQAVYQKLGRLPLGLSEAWLAESTARLRPVYPEAARLALAPALARLEVLIVDGKAIKRVAKRLKPLRGRKGGVLGGKALVALELRSGVVVAMATHADGETNDAKLVPALLPQVREHVRGKRLWVADRQFCDLTQPAAFAQAGDHCLVRYHPKTPFYAEAAHPVQRGQDAQGRVWEQAWGWLGSEQAKHRRFVRRLTLYRPGEETIILLTDLLDASLFPATDLLDLYLARWSIERVFQQITEVFHLQTLIGTTPQGTVFQFAFCVLLYNMVQVVRAYVATAQARPVPTISTELLFDDVHRQLVALTELVPAERIELVCPVLPTEEALRVQLTRLLATIWTNRWLKQPTKKRPAPAPRASMRGNHTSVFRLVVTYNKQRVKYSSQ
jgi:Transposase DDE domain